MVCSVLLVKYVLGAKNPLHLKGISLSEGDLFADLNPHYLAETA